MLMTRKCLLVLAVLAVMVSITEAQQPKSQARTSVDVYLLGGQSNMQGVGKIASLPNDVPKQIPHTYFWNQRTFEPLVLGTTKVSATLTTFGPEVGFALQTASADRPIYLVKYYASGMPLHHGWNGTEWVGGNAAPGRRNFYPANHQMTRRPAHFTLRCGQSSKALSRS